MRWGPLAGGWRVAGRFWLSSAAIVAAVWVFLNLAADAPLSPAMDVEKHRSAASHRIQSDGEAATLATPTIAVIIADYEDWDNRLADTVAAINVRAASAALAVEVAIIGETVPYPPPFGWDG